jgi:hypothetical protein
MHDVKQRSARTVRGTAAALILAILMIPGTVAAQAAGGPTPEELRAAAELLFTTPNRHGEAAELLCREADLRSSEDPRGIEAELLCGKLYYYAGELTRSRHALEDAAERALAMGDVIRAAHAYMDASLVAELQGRPRAVASLAGQARMLARSPLLTPGQRLAIEGRIGDMIPSTRAGI